MIKFESIGCVSITINGDTEIGWQVNIVNDGVHPLYGATSDDMGFKSFVMTVNFN